MGINSPTFDVAVFAAAVAVFAVARGLRRGWDGRGLGRPSSGRCCTLVFSTVTASSLAKVYSGRLSLRPETNTWISLNFLYSCLILAAAALFSAASIIAADCCCVMMSP